MIDRKSRVISQRFEMESKLVLHTNTKLGTPRRFNGRWRYITPEVGQIEIKKLAKWEYETLPVSSIVKGIKSFLINGYYITIDYLIVKSGCLEKVFFFGKPTFGGWLSDQSRPNMWKTAIFAVKYFQYIVFYMKPDRFLIWRSILDLTILNVFAVFAYAFEVLNRKIEADRFYILFSHDYCLLYIVLLRFVTFSLPR